MATRRRICRIRVLAENLPVWRMRVLAKMLFFGKWVGLDTFARHSPTTFPGLDTFARHSPALSPDSIHSPDIRQPFSPDSIHSRKANLHEFSEFSESEFGEFSECRLDRFIHKNIFFCI